MAIPVKVTWQDTNAPQLTEAASSLLAVLDFALLNNGWSKDFTDTDVAVYRAPSGNRKYYRIHDNNGYGYNGLYSAKVTGYDSMTDANTGAGWGSVSYIRKARSSGNKRWLVFVDAYGFMVITQPAGDTTTDVNTYPFIPHYIGDDVVLMPGNTPRAVICAAKDSSDDSYGGGSVS